MLMHQLTAIALLGSAALFTAAADADPARTGWYRDSVVNVHFDNHSSLLGKDVSPEDLAAMLGSLPVTMLQVSGQSNGYATYPTQVGQNNPEANGYDTLGAFKTATWRQGKKLCVYMSVDRRPLDLKIHPEWGHINAAGQQEIAGEPIVCQRPNREHKGYLYERFLPQIQEIARKYDPEGFWFDGDYQLTRPCWCPNCLKEWKADTGKDAPRDASSPDWGKWIAWHQARYKEYQRLVAETIHNASKKAIYTSNWSWAWTPEPVPEYVDTLSGDAWNIQQVHCVTQRWGAQQTPWDVMSYCVPESRAFGHGYSLQRTLQEGALTMASGGIWFLWSFGGSEVPPAGIEVTRFCAQFARDRQAALGTTQSLSSVAVLDSETSWRKGADPDAGGRVQSTARNLSEYHYLTDVVNEQTYRAARGRYAVVIVPEYRTVAPETLAALQEFVRDGGLLILTGGALRGDGEEPAAVAALLGLKREAPADKRVAALALGREKQYLPGAWKVTEETAKVITRFADGRPALTANTVGKGTVAYLASSSAPYPDDGLMAGVLRALGKGPSYTLSGNAGDAAFLCNLRGKPRQIILHLTDLSARVNNATADVNTTDYTDFNPVRRNVTVTVPLAHAPAQVRAVPTGTVVKSEYQDGRLHLTFANLQTHAAAILDMDTTTPTGFLPADTPWPQAAFHPAGNPADVSFDEDFERTAVGKAPANPWVAETKGETAIAVTDTTAASGKRSLQFTDAENSSFWPFLHRSIPPFHRGRARLAFDLRVERGVMCDVEARYEGKGAGPSLRVDGEGKMTASGKALTTIAPDTWNRVEITFSLGTDNPSYAVQITAPGKEPQRFDNLPYASEWFYRCDSIYFVGSGQRAGKFYLDNVSFERLGD